MIEGFNLVNTLCLIILLQFIVPYIIILLYWFSINKVLSLYCIYIFFCHYDVLWYGMYIMYFCIIWWQIWYPVGLLSLIWIWWMYNKWLIGWLINQLIHQFIYLFVYCYVVKLWSNIYLNILRTWNSVNCEQ